MIELTQILGKEHVRSSYDICDQYSSPPNSHHTSSLSFDVVVYPKTIEEISEIVKICNKNCIPLVPYGGGTSLEGHTTSISGGVCIDMGRFMKGIVRFSEEDMDITVQAGLGYLELNRFLSSHGLWFPLDPGPGATVGGMCACRCSGSTAVRYGTMRDNVVNIKAVLPTGQIIQTGQRSRKSAAGYDITRLLIGSEGTLGIIVEVTLRLQKIPKHATAIRVAFNSVKDAAAVACATLQAGIPIGRCELLDEVMIGIINQANDTSFPVAPTLLFELTGGQESVKEQQEIVMEIIERHNPISFQISADPEECKEMWRIRKEALWAAQSVYPDTTGIITDVCVPISNLPNLIELVQQEIAKTSLVCPIFAHAGDGNIHVYIMFERGNEVQICEAKNLSSTMVHQAIKMDGTCTGEHGVGVGKQHYLEAELGRSTLELMGKIKNSIDPNNIMNPGKVIPPQFCEATKRK